MFRGVQRQTAKNTCIPTETNVKTRYRNEPISIYADGLYTYRILAISYFSDSFPIDTTHFVGCFAYYNYRSYGNDDQVTGFSTTAPNSTGDL